MSHQGLVGASGADLVLKRWALRILVLEAVYWGAEGAVYRPTNSHQDLRELLGEGELRAAERLLAAGDLVQPVPEPAGALALTHTGLLVIEEAILDPQLRTPFGTLGAARSLVSPEREGLKRSGG